MQYVCAFGVKTRTSEKGGEPPIWAFHRLPYVQNSFNGRRHFFMNVTKTYLTRYPLKTEKTDAIFWSKPQNTAVNMRRYLGINHKVTKQEQPGKKTILRHYLIPQRHLLSTPSDAFKPNRTITKKTYNKQFYNLGEN